MKKLRFVPIVALLLCLLSVTALAAETPATELKPTSGQTYTVEYNTGAVTNVGKQYVILILKSGVTPANLTVDSILYIDQAAAGVDGKVKFENFQLMTHISADVYIGGEGLTGPVNPYKIVVSGISVSGKVTFISGSVGRRADVKLTDGGTNMFTCKTDVAGNFKFDTVPAGNYTLIATAESHVSYTKKNIVVSGTEITNLTGTLLAGGLNGDMNINFSDLTLLLNNYNKTCQTGLQAADVNDDSNINFADLTLLLNNYNKVAIDQ